jgi:hypothetical protein
MLGRNMRKREYIVSRNIRKHIHSSYPGIFSVSASSFFHQLFNLWLGFPTTELIIGFRFITKSITIIFHSIVCPHRTEVDTRSTSMKPVCHPTPPRDQLSPKAIHLMVLSNSFLLPKSLFLLYIR